MPYRKRSSKRTYKRRARRNRVPKQLALTGFPKNKIVKLRYVQEITLTTPTTTGLSTSLPFVANGCYDPFYPIGGHQPKGFDQWMAVYANYNVLGSKCSMRMLGTGNDAFVWGVARTATPNELDGKTLEFILECRMNKGFAVAGGYQRNNNMPTSTTRISKYSQKKQHGPNSTNAANLIGTNGANPDELTIFECWMVPAASNSASLSANFIVTIDYIVMLTEQKILGQS